MLSRLKAVVLFVVHAVLILSLLSIALKLLSGTETEKEGIFKILVLMLRSLSTSQANQNSV